jgi:hypothetical protein
MFRASDHVNECNGILRYIIRVRSHMYSISSRFNVISVPLITISTYIHTANFLEEIMTCSLDSKAGH